MNDYRETLKKVGYVLIIIGTIDIGAMVYCIMNNIAYASSLNIFALIAGLFLLKGGLKTALNVSQFSAFLLGGTIGFPILVLSIVPIDLIKTFLSLYPATFIGMVIYVIILASILYWVYNQLASRIVLEAIDKAGIDRITFLKRPKTGFFAGGFIIILLLIILPLSLSGETASVAIAKAKDKVGNNYNFFVSSMQSSYDGQIKHYRTSVIAYNQNDIKEIEFEWSK